MASTSCWSLYRCYCCNLCSSSQSVVLSCLALSCPGFLYQVSVCQVPCSCTKHPSSEFPVPSFLRPSVSPLPCCFVIFICRLCLDICFPLPCRLCYIHLTNSASLPSSVCCEYLDYFLPPPTQLCCSIWFHSAVPFILFSFCFWTLLHYFPFVFCHILDCFVLPRFVQ